MAEHALVAAIEEAVQQARNMRAPLAERLGLIASSVRDLSPPFADSVERMVVRLQQHGAGLSAPQPGEPMPPFVLPDADGKVVVLADLLARGPVVVSFNRGHWCPYCRINVLAMAEVQDLIAASGCQVVAITPERAKFSAALRDEAAADFPMLTDMDNGYALSLGLAISVGAEMETLISSAGWDLPKYQGNNAWILPVPATFVLNRDGIIVARFVEPDYRTRMDIDALLQMVRLAADQPSQPIAAD